MMPHFEKWLMGFAAGIQVTSVVYCVFCFVWMPAIRRRVDSLVLLAMILILLRRFMVIHEFVIGWAGARSYESIIGIATSIILALFFTREVKNR